MPKQPNNYSQYVGHAFTIITPIFLGYFGGAWLDERYQTGTTWTITLCSIAIVLALYLFIKPFISPKK